MMNFDSGLRLLPTLLLTLFCSLAISRGSSNDGPVKHAGQAVFRSVPEVAIPKSIFNLQPEDRNPFFPRSTVAAELPKPNKETQPDHFALVLNGLTSAPKPTAMVNGKTLEPGEEADVRLRDGSKIHIRCLEIRTDSAVIELNGQRLELRLRLGY
jgi:hypothetical protein